MAELDPPCAEDRASRLELMLLALLAVATFLVRLWGIPHMHAWDEDVYLQNAELICCGKANFNEIDSRPPLLSLIYAGVFLLWHSDYAAWIVTALLNAAGPVFLYLGGRAFVGRIAAGIAAVLLAFLPFFVDADRGLLSDGPALTAITIAFWVLVCALRKQTDLRFALAGFALAMSILMRFGSVSSAGMLSLLVLAANRKLRSILACGAGFAAGLLPYFGWSRVRYGGYLATIQSGWLNFGGPEKSRLYFVRHFPEVLSWATLAGLLLCIVRVIYERHKTPRSYKLWRVGYLGLWAIVVLWFFSSLSHKEVRYMMPVAPPLLLLAGLGLSVLVTMRQRLMQVAGSSLLAVALLIVFWPIRNSFDSDFLDRHVSEEMTVSDYLKKNVPSSTVLYTNQNYPDFAYYTNFEVDPLPHDGPELLAGLNALPKDGVLIAYRKDDDGTPIGPDLAWVDANPHYVRLREFPKLIVYRYTVRPR